MALVKSVLWAGIAFSCVLAQDAYYPPAFPTSPMLPSTILVAPSVTPNVLDNMAPNAQQQCPGYKASNVQETEAGVTADLTLAGQACNVYGTDILELSLSVEYQSTSRLAVRIIPKYLTSENESLYVLAPELTPFPSRETDCDKGKSDLNFNWSNEPSFQFQIVRNSSGDVLFSTYGSVIVFEDQFLELSTQMIPDYNIYGFAEGNRGFRLPNNYTQTFWSTYNLTNDQLLDVNTHDTHPVYLETRYANNTSSSHGVYARNAHGQDWVLKPESLTYRTIGGSFDLYFLSGPTPKEVISQYHLGIVKTPVIPPYWALGFMQCRWGYQNWTELQDVIDGYAAQNIQLEAIMNDLDYLLLNRIFTNSPNYPLDEGKEFLDRLHANGQYYLPILNPHVYVPNPDDAGDQYSTYQQGAMMNAYIRNGDEGWYYGVQWPGFSVWTDFHPNVPQAQEFWTQQILAYHEQLAFDGWWIDVTDPTSFCTGSCGTGQLNLNPIHVPFALPGDPDTMLTVNYMYPAGFETTNASEAASASSALMSQSSAYPMQPTPAPPVQPRTTPVPGVHNLNFPPYAIYNHLGSGALEVQVVSPNATSNDPHNSTQYELHNLYGHLSANATYQALLQVKPGERPWFIARSTFAGTGNFAGTWGGDTNSDWTNMYYGISQALQFSIAGIPYFGVETCGFNGNTDMELCTRWMQLSAWYPFYRNHNNRNTISQEAYRWATTAESTRVIMNIRYSLLPYTYTLFWQAHQQGETVLRALAWEFPDDASLATIETQFMSGPALLITPVLEPLATTVSGVFPGVGSGTVWYDWYTLQKVDAAAGENKTLSAPLTHQPIHVRGGYIIPMQQAGNTTATSRKNPWSLLIALDEGGSAQGTLYLDDGISLIPETSKSVEFSYTGSKLSATVSGDYNDGLSLANITVAGYSGQSANATLSIGDQQQDIGGARITVENGTLYITDLEEATSSGVWSDSWSLELSV